MHKSIDFTSLNEGAGGAFLIYLYQGLKLMILLAEKGVYFGDFKPENILVTFKHKILKLGDFGCSFFIHDHINFIKGLSYKYTTPEAL